MSKFDLIAGVDEAGRGPLAGSVIAAAVILNPDQPIVGLTDSKMLTAKKREQLFSIICEKSLVWSVGRAEPEEIDTINIFQATLLAMKRAIESLSINPQHVQIDGTHCPRDLACSSEAIIRGDQLIPAISAASIVAKVLRDREMLLYDQKFPNYGFAKHKGYGTKLHLDNLRKFGPCAIHRKTFEPIKTILS